MSGEEITTIKEKSQAIQLPVSLRDYFAGQAIISFANSNNSDSWEIDAKAAYAVADAMLKQREAK